MRITKQGTPPPPITLKGVCRNCKTEAEAEVNELTRMVGGTYKATCPVCGFEAMLFNVPLPYEKPIEIRENENPFTIRSSLGLKGEWAPPKDGDA